MHPALPPLATVLTSLAATPILARYAAPLGLIDRPGPRKVHTHAVPRIGGLAFGLGLAVGVAAYALGSPAARLERWLPWLLPLAGFLVLGWADDRRGIPPLPKFLLQALLCSLAVALGLRWGGGGLGPFPELHFGAATPILTGVWLVAVVTVVNWIDGLDLITAATCLVMLAAGAGVGAGPADGALYAWSALALLGVAFWNVTPAHAFLGDAGTHALGFLVGALALERPGFDLGAVPWALASAPLLPGVIDIAWALWVKARRGVPLWQAHRQHLHQRLARSGVGHVRVALRYGLLSLAAVALVARVGPRYGLLACAGGGGLVLCVHLLLVARRTHALPYEFAADDDPSPRPPAA